MNETETRDAVTEGLKTLGRIADAFEKVAKLLSWSRRDEKKREKQREQERPAVVNWQTAKLTADNSASKCVYCSAIDRGLRRGNVYFGCMTCVGDFMAEVGADKGDGKT